MCTVYTTTHTENTHVNMYSVQELHSINTHVNVYSVHDYTHHEYTCKCIQCTKPHTHTINTHEKKHKMHVCTNIWPLKWI